MGDQGKGRTGNSKLLCSEYDNRADLEANETVSREWDHSCYTENLAVDGTYFGWGR